jgi:hypothetical protein
VQPLRTLFTLWLKFPAVSFAELMFVHLHIDFSPAKPHSLRFQAKSLLQRILAPQLDFAAGA